ncbi:MAG: PH domain-containing protein [Kiritimatiellaeota bacterium]|nr:PH domain-containing protein [Kiritimatiellota bacterium]
MKHSGYKAPWGKALKVTSVAVSLLSAVVMATVCLLVPPGWAKGVSVMLVLLTIVPCALFTVRGYTLTANELLIQRLLWETRIPLQGLRSAEVVPEVMTKGVVIRTCGNGGLFSFTGLYWSKPLGHFRAFVTDLSNPVVLRFDRRTVVISPSAPEAFVRDISTVAPVA